MVALRPSSVYHFTYLPVSYKTTFLYVFFFILDVTRKFPFYLRSVPFQSVMSPLIPHNSYDV